MRRFVLALLFLASPLFAADSPAGRWEGAIVLPALRLEVQVDLAGAEQAWSGDISIPLQQARDLPLTAITVSGNEVTFRIAGVPGDPTFSGVLQGNELAGSFTQNGQKFPFTLQRSGAAAPAAPAVPKSATAPQPATPVAPRGGSAPAIDSMITSALEQWDVPGIAIGVVQNGKILWAKGFGKRDVASGLPMTGDTLLPIGSITKSFTTAVLGTLVDEGKVAWDRPVRTYLPWFRGYDEMLTAELTVRDLLTHRSGLPRHDLVWYNNQDLTRRQLVERIAFLPPNKRLRETWQYNNLMFLTAGVLIEELTGKPWESAVRDRILSPLGMKRSTFSDAEAVRDGDHAQPYREKDGKVSEVAFREVGNMGPAGSISSSANEMALYALLQLSHGRADGKQLLQASTIAEIQTPQMAVGRTSDDPDVSAPVYGMGWFVDSYRSHARVSHGGNIDGFSALLTLFPNDDLAIVALANLEGTPLPGVVTNHIADQLLRLDPRDWNADRLAKRNAARAVAKDAESKKAVVRKIGTRPTHPLADYAGEYENPGYGVLTIGLVKQQLVATYNHITTPLEHWHYDVFNAMRVESDPTFEDMKYHFRDDVSGNIAIVEAPFEPSVDPIVFRKRPDRRMSDPAYLRQFTGDYLLAPQVISVSLRGSMLVLTIAGQPPYELVPQIDGWFELASLTGFRARFSGDTLELAQPNGLFIAKRK
jgi:CubicO group peptidase (beta-lactamase class C family)